MCSSDLVCVSRRQFGMDKRGVKVVSPRYIKNIGDMVQRRLHEYIETQLRLNGAFARRGLNSHSKRVNKKHSVGKLFLS